MGLKKKRDAYFISYKKGERIQVPEEVYRAWVYFVNRERHWSKQYSPRLVHKDGKEIVMPSRLVSFEDFILNDFSEQLRYNPDINYDRKSLAEVLSKCIDSLPEKQSRTITLLFYDGMTEAKAAQFLNVAQSSISNYKRDALRMLRLLLEAEGYCKEDLFSMLHR